MNSGTLCGRPMSCSLGFEREIGQALQVASIGMSPNHFVTRNRLLHRLTLP